MRSIPINDIRPPVRFTVTSRNQLLTIIRGAKYVRDAIEITLDGLGTVYYICEMTEHNAQAREKALSRASSILHRNIPARFNAMVKERPDIPADILHIGEAA